MSKKKIIIGIITTALLSAGASFITANYIHVDKPIDLNAVQNAYQTAMQQQLDKQKEELKSQYDEEYKEKDKDKDKTVENMCIQLADVIGKYYTEHKNEVNITKNVSLDNFDISFSNEKKNQVTDNDNKLPNIYSINNTISILNKGKTLRGSLTIDIEYKSDQKFDISNNKLLIDYFNIILNRELTDDEKNAINIGVNMNLNDLSSIKDLKNYIYNNNQIKIDNSVISTKNSHPKIKDKDGNEIDDITKTITELTIVTDENNRFYKDPEEK